MDYNYDNSRLIMVMIIINTPKVECKRKVITNNISASWNHLKLI